MENEDRALREGAVGASILQRTIRRYPEREAIVDGDRRYTYEEYGNTISSVMQALVSAGLRRGQGVGVLSKNRAEPLFVLGAAQALGLRYTPLHPLGSIDDHAFVIADAGISLLIFDGEIYGEHVEELLSRLASPLDLLAFDPNGLCANLRDALGSHPPKAIEIEARPEDILQILYTGGTTGQPKGVVWSQRMFVNQTKQFLAEFDWPEQVRFVAAAPVSHALLGLIPPVHAKGGALLLNNGFDPIVFMETVQNEKATVAFLVPTMIYTLLDHPRIDEFDLSSLEMIIYGASPMSHGRLTDALKRFGPIFCQLYGQTESAVLTSLGRSDHDPARPHLLASCGFPLVGIEVKLLDAEGAEVATGEVGELCVRGPSVMDGYWNLPEETAMTLRDGWLHTGDMARQDERGYLYLVDRSKDMIISGGFNVYPREIENVLDGHDAVATSAVIGVPHEKWGEAVVAFVVLSLDQQATEEELIRLVRDRKGRVYAPKKIIFIDSLPLTGLGKIDKKALRTPFWQGRERQIA